MTPDDLQNYLHAHIPLSAAMQVRVDAATAEQVVLWAPLAPNINHRETVFGGSASALAILSAWSLLHLRLVRADCHARLVIQRNTTRYERAIAGDFTACAASPDAAAWEGFLRLLARRGRARIAVASQLQWRGQAAGHFEGEFVALSPEAA